MRDADRLVGRGGRLSRFFCLAGRGVVNMLDDLEWLEDLLERRGRVAGEVRRMQARRMPLTNPYVADAPDGPLVKLDANFEQGPSWWADPSLTA